MWGVDNALRGLDMGGDARLSMKGKTCIVTGATSGIGKATARGLAEMGATVVMAVRNPERSEAVRREIREQTGNQEIEFFLVDLASQASIRRFAADFKKEFPRLDVVVNNAGVYRTQRQVTEDGLEMTFAVNYLARFLLVNLLEDILRKSAPARVVNVAGAYHARGEIDFDNLQLETGYSGARANSNAKLADVLFTYELARQMKGTGVTANCLHPGAVRSRIIAKDPDVPRSSLILYSLVRPFMKSPERGADTVLYLATSPEVEGVTGGYFVGRKARRSSSTSYDTALAKQLWDVSQELVRR